MNGAAELVGKAWREIYGGGRSSGTLTMAPCPTAYTLELEALGVRPVVSKQSGFGREECLEEMLRFTREKNIHVKLRHTLALPPR